MLNWLKKRPRITRADLEALIEATPDADPKNHVFLVPKRLELELFLFVLRRPFAVGLYALTFKGYKFYPADEPKPHAPGYGYENSEGIFVRFIDPASTDLTLVARQSWWPGFSYR